MVGQGRDEPHPGVGMGRSTRGREAVGGGSGQWVAPQMLHFRKPSFGNGSDMCLLDAVPHMERMDGLPR